MGKLQSILYSYSNSLYTTYSYYMQGIGSDKDFFNFLNKGKSPKNQGKHLGDAWRMFVRDISTGSNIDEARNRILSLPFWNQGMNDENLYIRRMAICNKEWDAPAIEASKKVKNCTYNKKMTGTLVIPGAYKCFFKEEIDFFSNDCIYVTKFSSEYDVGKYCQSIQHILYMYISGCKNFEYLVLDDDKGRGGSCVQIESYKKEKDLEDTLRSKVTETVDWILSSPFKDVFIKNWKIAG